MGIYKLHAPFPPAGDQPEAIRRLQEGFRAHKSRQTLLGNRIIQSHSFTAQGNMLFNYSTTTCHTQNRNKNRVKAMVTYTTFNTKLSG